MPRGRDLDSTSVNNPQSEALEAAYFEEGASRRADKDPHPLQLRFEFAFESTIARGAARLRQELDKLRGAGDQAERIAELEHILSSVTIVEAPDEPTKSVAFGARVTARDATEQLKTYSIVGVDELDFESDAVSWISPIGRALLTAELGDQVTLEQVGPIKVVKIEYPTH